MPTETKTKPVIKKPVAKKVNYYYAIGRRKTATARVRLYLKSGDLSVNFKPIDKYFPGPVDKVTYLKPFRILGLEDKYSFTALIEGSGKNAQLGALLHGLSRALVKANPDHKSPLKAAGLLTRDSRMRESRKVGTGGKARRKKQSPKR